MDISYITSRDILSGYYTSYLFSLIVIFGRSVFDLFGRMVRNLAVRFSIYSAVWIWPSPIFSLKRLELKLVECKKSAKLVNKVQEDWYCSECLL